MSDIEFTPEMQHNVVTTWRKIQGSAELIDGLLFGEFDDLITGLLNMMIATGLIRQIPLALARRGTKIESMESTIEYGRELLRLSVVKEALDKLSRETEL